MRYFNQFGRPCRDLDIPSSNCPSDKSLGYFQSARRASRGSSDKQRTFATPSQGAVTDVVGIQLHSQLFLRHAQRERSLSLIAFVQVFRTLVRTSMAVAAVFLVCAAAVSAQTETTPHEESSTLRLIQIARQAAGRQPEVEYRDRGLLLQGVDLKGGDFRRAMIAYSQLQEADLSGALLDEIVLSKADLTEARLVESSLIRADITRAVLARADLSHANLSDANLVGADLRGADLTAARLDGVWLSFADLRGVHGLSPQQLERARWHPASPPMLDEPLKSALGHRFEAASVTGGASGLQGPDLSAAYLPGENLEDGNLIGSNLRGAVLRNANLRGANLKGADLTNADLSGADLRRARFLTPAQLKQARWDPQNPPLHDLQPGGELPGVRDRMSGLQPIDELFAGSIIIDGVVSYTVRDDPDCRRDCASRALDFAEVTRSSGIHVGATSVSGSAERIRRVRDYVISQPSALLIESAGDLERVRREQKYGVILYSQQVPLLNGDAGAVNEWFEAGLRIVQPAYSRDLPAPDQLEENKLAGGADEPNQGLTALGREVIRELARLKMLIDVSHCSEATTMDIIGMTDVPILANHANAQALTVAARGSMLLGRNKTDRELRAIAGTGGVIGVNPVAWMLDRDGDTRANIDDFLAHLDYMVQLVGEDHVGVASDSGLDGWAPDDIHYADIELAAPDRWKRVAERLREQYGYGDLRLKKIFGLNFKRVYEQVLPAAAAPAGPVTAQASQSNQRGQNDAYRQQALALLKEVPLIDGHNDVPWQYFLRTRGHLDPIDLNTDTARLDPPMHTDFRRLKEGRVGGQFWSVYIPAEMGGPGAARAVLGQIDLVHRLIARYPDRLELALTAEDVKRIHATGKVASLIGVEGGHAIENSLAVLRQMYALGARYMTLTHNQHTDWADSATDAPRHDGLTAFGREVVREMNRLGMLVDISHVSPKTMHDVLDSAESAVIFSHSSARGLVDYPRNVPDDVLRRIPENGGVIMVNFVRYFVCENVRQYNAQLAGEEPRLRKLFPHDPSRVQSEYEQWQADHPPPRCTLEDVANHIDYIRNLIGSDYIGIGSDFDGLKIGPAGLEDVSDYPALFAELLRRGYSESEVRNIAGLNLLRVLRQAEQTATRLQSERGPSEVLIDELD